MTEEKNAPEGGIKADTAKQNSTRGSKPRVLFIFNIINFKLIINKYHFYA